MGGFRATEYVMAVARVRFRDRMKELEPKSEPKSEPEFGKG